MSELVAYSSSAQFPRRQQNAARRLAELETQFRLAVDARQRALIADALVPEYVSRGDAHAAEEALASVEDTDEPEIAARITALRAVAAAMRGLNPDAQIQRSLDLVAAATEQTAATVQQRVAVAYAFARRPSEAEEHALQALWISDINGLRFVACRAASVLYFVHYHLTGDLHAARQYAEVLGIEAVAAGDNALRRLALYQQYDLAAVFAEWDRAVSIRTLLRRDLSEDVYGNTYVVPIADCILSGQKGDFAAIRALMPVITSLSRDTADHALAHAIHAVALAGLGIDDEARKEARRSLGLSREPTGTNELSHLTIRRRLGAVLSAYACTLIGDVVRGTRALEVREKWPGAIGTLAQVLRRSTLRGCAIDLNDPSLQSIKGYAALAASAARARALRAQLEARVVRTLTDTELMLLRSAAKGKTNGEIARERGVSRNAVERRLMSAYEKLGVRSRAEAIAKLETAETL